MPRNLIRAALLAAAVLFAPSAGAQPAAKPLDATERKAVVEGVAERVEADYVFPEVGKKMAADVRARLANKEYDSITGGEELAELLTKHLREICKDKHLRVRHFPEPPPQSLDRGPSPEQQRRMRDQAAVRNFGFKKVERLGAGGVGLLELEGFLPADAVGETAAAAMTFLANSEAVIVDLRQNGGGSPETVVLLCSYFFDRPTHLNDIYTRATDSTRQYWSHPSPPGKRLAGKDVYVLTSGRTFSGAEEFAYNLQAQKRATIVGETTGGGAHPTRGFRVADRFLIGVPFARSINPVTKTNWEGTGVKPDVPVPAAQALHTAHLLALEKAAGRHAKDPEMAAAVKRETERVRKELDGLKAGDKP